MDRPSRVILADVMDGLAQIADGSAHCCVTSPPYWGLRDYGVEGQIGLEATPDAFVETMVRVFREVRRVLRDDGTLWLNLGDSYARQGGSGTEGSSDGCVGRGDAGRGCCSPPIGLKPKDLCMIPWRVALALQADGWWLRSVICWQKRSPMPESVTDRPTSSWEPIFLLAKGERYFYDAEAVKEPSASPQRAGHIERSFSTSDPSSSLRADVGREVMRTASRNMRNVWTLSSDRYTDAHFATFPTEIPRRAISAGTSEKGCCPQCGAGWVIAPSGRDGRIPGNGQRATSGAMVSPPTSRTTGWQPGCKCDAGEPIPCTVLDPFLGSGTTVATARTLGRHGIGIELNPEYARMARNRIAMAEKPSTAVIDKPADAPLFGASA